MSEDAKSKVGEIVWHDLTVPNASEVRDFYKAVVGWETSDEQNVHHDDADYSDYNMLLPGSQEVTAGIIHARGANANLPAQWLIYITVENLDESIAACEKLGGKVIEPVRDYGNSRYCVIQDPAGAICALFQP